MRKYLFTSILTFSYLLFLSGAPPAGSATFAPNTGKAAKQDSVKTKKKKEGSQVTPLPSVPGKTPANDKRAPIPFLKILKVRVYFNNNRSRTTVKRHQSGLRAYADIDYIGSGSLKGYWKVNGMVHSPVKIYLKSGRRITIGISPKVPLPTDRAGPHRVRLVIATPSQKGLFPGALYFVTQDLSKEEAKYDTPLQEEKAFVPGQILLVSKTSQKGGQLLGYLSKKYDLRLLDAFDLKTLGLRIAVFYTGKDVLKVVKDLENERGVISAQPNHIFRTMNEPLSDMQNVFKLLNLGKLHENCKGKGVKVAVVDTGVDREHRDLVGSILCHENFVRGSPYKGEIHGTAVAGVIGASINGYGIVGVAPEVEILALRACRQKLKESSEGECYTSSLSKALDTTIAKRANIVNMSFGAALPDPLLRLLIDEGAKRKVIFIAPAGNRVDQEDLWFPASHRDVVAVAGIDEKGNPYPNPDIASKADTCAPAVNVFTTIPDNRHNFMNGTSMASATVAGLMAVKVRKNGAVNRDSLPAFKGDVCQWAEELLGINICER